MAKKVKKKRATNLLLPYLLEALFVYKVFLVPDDWLKFKRKLVSTYE